MKKFTTSTLLLSMTLLITGCATSLTPGGQKIKVLRDDDPEKVAGCVRLAKVTGESGSLLSGGEYGLYYATVDARNQAAVIKGGDTLLITRTQPSTFGGAIEGIVYNCLSPHVAQAAPETPRKMLPPPIVSATSTPRSTTSFTSWAMAASVGGEMPYFASPMSASPESLRRMRLYRTFGFSARSLGMIGRVLHKAGGAVKARRPM